MSSGHHKPVFQIKIKIQKLLNLQTVKARGDIYRSSLLFEQVEHVDGLLEFAILDKREDN